MTPKMHEYLKSSAQRYAEVTTSDLKAEDKLILFIDDGKEFAGIRIIVIDEVTPLGERFVTLRSGEETFKLKRGIHFAIVAETPMLIGRIIDGYKVVGQRPISPYPSDAHLVNVIANRIDAEPTASIWGTWATLQYNHRKDLFFDGDYDLTYGEAMDDFSSLKRSKVRLVK